jgi:hypothetical protein
MKFDLVVIAILQAAALAYGVSVLFESRPVFVVYVKDRFELVRANQVAEQDLGGSAPAKRERLSITGPRLVGVRMPTDADERFKLSISALGGMDAQSYPQYHVPYEEVRAQAGELARPLAKLRQLNRDRVLEIDRIAARLGKNEEDLGFLPMRAGKHDLAVIVSKRNGDVLAYTSLRPWEY